MSAKVATLCGLVVSGLLLLSVPSSADQNAPELSALFAALGHAENPARATEIEGRIWDYWLAGPNDDASARLANARARLSVGEFDLAAPALDALIKEHPDFAEPWNQRALLRYLKGDYRGSLADIEHTLTLEPKHFGALAGRGQCLLQMNQAADALVAFEAAIAIHPWLVDVNRNIEMLKIYLNETTKGI